MSRAKQTLHLSRMTIWGLNVYSPPTKLEAQGAAGQGGIWWYNGDSVSHRLRRCHVCVNPPTQSAQTDITPTHFNWKLSTASASALALAFLLGFLGVPKFQTPNSKLPDPKATITTATTLYNTSNQDRVQAKLLYYISALWWAVRPSHGSKKKKRKENRKRKIE